MKSTALLTIKSPGTMTKRQRKNIIGWLRSQANHFSKHGDEYTHGRFTARFIYTK